jgi:hypothetical protein
MKRILVVVVTIAGMVLGLWHLWFAAQAIFVFRSGEPWTSWVFMLSGPVSTLPAVLLSLFLRRAAGYWLIAGSLVSLGVFVVGDTGASEYFLPFFRMTTAPMCLLGVAMLLLSSRKPSAAPALS